LALHPFDLLSTGFVLEAGGTPKCVPPYGTRTEPGWDWLYVEALEIRRIEGLDFTNEVDVHSCNQAGVVHLHAMDVVPYDQALPLRVNGGGLGR